MSYQPPSQPEGEEASPSGAYAPSSYGGYSAPPPPPSGGYTPPSDGGYGAPPGGGYSSSSGGAVPPGGNPSNIAHLPRSYLRAVLKPGVETYESEAPNASWLKVLLGIALLSLIGLILTLIGTASTSPKAIMDETLRQMTEQRQPDVAIRWVQENRAELESWAGLFLTLLPFVALLQRFVTFFLGAGAQHIAARIAGGARGGSFMTHAYLASLSYVPIALAITIINLLGGLGGAQNPLGLLGACIVLILFFYQIFCVGVSMQVSQRMEPGKAQLAAYLPLVLMIGLFLCLCAVLIVLAAGGGGSAG